jgi:hypothetical protein|tara:strand:- start:495 stop:605 length:111 start_codon:yes stop_codon:yes gene_type:complete
MKEETFYSEFIAYVRTNNYSVYCRAMEYAISKSDED